MTREEFRNELNRLYAEACARDFIAADLASAAKCSRHTMVKWLGGYACPATSEARKSIIAAILATPHLHEFQTNGLPAEACLRCGFPQQNHEL